MQVDLRDASERIRQGIPSDVQKPDPEHVQRVFTVFTETSIEARSIRIIRGGRWREYRVVRSGQSGRRDEWISRWRDVRKDHPAYFARRDSAEERVYWSLRAVTEAERNDDVDAAIFHLDQLIKLDGDNWRWRYRRGLALEYAGESARALDDYAMAIKLGADRPDPWVRRGSLLSSEERYDEAYEDLSVAIAKRPGDARAHTARIQVSVALRRWDQVAEDLEALVRLAPNEKKHWSALAAVHLHRRDLAAYQSACARALSHLSTQGEWAMASALLLNGLSVHSKADWEEHARIAEGTTDNSENRKMKLVSGIIDYRSERFEESLASLSVGGDPFVSSLTLLFMAMSEERLGRKEKAGLLLQRAQATILDRFATIDGPPLHGVHPPRWAAWLMVQTVLREAEDLIDSNKEPENVAEWEQAITELGHLIQQQPTEWKLYVQRGSARENMGKLDEALVDYQRAIDLAPDEPEAYVRRGAVLMRQGDPESALADLDRAVGYRPNDVGFRKERCKANAILDRWDAVTEDCEKTVLLSPQDGRNWMALAAAHLRRNDVDTYADACQRGIEALRDGNQWAQADAMIMCCLAAESGVAPDLLRQLTAKIESNPHSARRGLALGMVHYRNDDFATSISHLPKSGDPMQVAMGLLFKAMAECRLDSIEDPPIALRQAQANARRHVSSLHGPPLADHLPPRWAVWCMIQTVLGEAEAVFGDSLESK